MKDSIQGVPLTMPEESNEGTTQHHFKMQNGRGRKDSADPWHQGKQVQRKMKLLARPRKNDLYKEIKEMRISKSWEQPEEMQPSLSGFPSLLPSSNSNEPTLGPSFLSVMPESLISLTALLQEKKLVRTLALDSVDVIQSNSE